VLSVYLSILAYDLLLTNSFGSHGSAGLGPCFREVVIHRRRHLGLRSRGAVGAQSLRSSSAWRVFGCLSRLPAVTIPKSVPGRQCTVDYAVTERLFALDGDDDCVVWPLVWPNGWKSCCKVL
jgi:hypothetical protein